MSLEQIRRRLAEFTRDDGRVDDNADQLKYGDTGWPPTSQGSYARPDEPTWSRIMASLSKAQTQTPENYNPAQATQQNLNFLTQNIATDAAKVLQLQAQIAEMEAQTPPADAAPLNEAKHMLAVFQGALQGRLQKAQAMAKALGKEGQLKAEWFKAAGLPEPDHGGNTVQMKAMSNGAHAGAAQQMANQGKSQTTGVFQPPPLWGAQTVGSDVHFPSAAFMQSQMASDLIGKSMDSVFANQNRGRQLMMLFHYFAQRAASGDLGQMYQFMKFLTYIISKDKAKQQIDMGNKLIQLQDESRRVTDILMNQNTNSSDPNANNEFMKTMTWAKSQSDAIATSQKLISQMMEEFAQIVETLTNSTKTALEAYGRALRTVSGR